MASSSEAALRAARRRTLAVVRDLLEALARDLDEVAAVVEGGRPLGPAELQRLVDFDAAVVRATRELGEVRRGLGRAGVPGRRS